LISPVKRDTIVVELAHQVPAYVTNDLKSDLPRETDSKANRYVPEQYDDFP
jgi:hypothetical protein